MNSLNSFYYKILNINKSADMDNIIKSIDSVKKVLKEKNINNDRMCKVISNLIYNELISNNVSSKIINTKELFNCYEHEFVLCHYYKDDINYILIDLTYSQFITTSKINKSFVTSPSSIINNETLSNLINNGYSVIDEEIFQNYLFSIHQNKNNIGEYTLEELINVKRR